MTSQRFVLRTVLGSALLVAALLMAACGPLPGLTAVTATAPAEAVSYTHLTLPTNREV